MLFVLNIVRSFFQGLHTFQYLMEYGNMGKLAIYRKIELSEIPFHKGKVLLIQYDQIIFHEPKIIHTVSGLKNECEFANDNR